MLDMVSITSIKISMKKKEKGMLLSSQNTCEKEHVEASTMVIQAL